MRTDPLRLIATIINGQGKSSSRTSSTRSPHKCEASGISKALNRILPSAKSATSLAPGVSIVLIIVCEASSSGLMSSSKWNFVYPTSSRTLDKDTLRTRAILLLAPNDSAKTPTTKLVSSEVVTAITKSACSIPAFLRASGSAPLPTMTLASSFSSAFRAISGSASII